MPEYIATVDIVGLDAEHLETDDAFPGTYGFSVELSRKPHPEWATEFETAYNAVPYPGKPPILFHGDRLCVFYLPRYADDLPSYLRFLQATVAQTNRSAERRNAALPDEAAQKEAFRERLRSLARTLNQGTQAEREPV